MRLGFERQRARDADALPLAAGELVRIARIWSAAGPTCSNSSATRSCFARPVASPWTPSGSPTMSPRRHARVERGERVLEDDLHRAAMRPQLAPCRAA